MIELATKGVISPPKSVTETPITVSLDDDAVDAVVSSDQAIAEVQSDALEISIQSDLVSAEAASDQISIVTICEEAAPAIYEDTFEDGVIGSDWAVNVNNGYTVTEQDGVFRYNKIGTSSAEFCEYKNTVATVTPQQAFEFLVRFSNVDFGSTSGQERPALRLDNFAVPEDLMEIRINRNPAANYFIQVYRFDGGTLAQLATVDSGVPTTVNPLHNNSLRIIGNAGWSAVEMKYRLNSGTETSLGTFDFSGLDQILLPGLQFATGSGGIGNINVDWQVFRKLA